MGDERLVRIGGAFTKLRPENVVMIGLRDIDPPEKETLKRLNIKYYTYWQAEEAGLARCAEEAAEHLRRCKSVHVSFDIDVTDPKLFPVSYTHLSKSLAWVGDMHEGTLNISRRKQLKN